jgi:hypothetical protein
MPYPSLSSYVAFDSPDTVVFHRSYSSTYIAFEWPAIRKQRNDNAWINSSIPHLGLIASPIGASAIWCSTGTQRSGAVSDPQTRPSETAIETPLRRLPLVYACVQGSGVRASCSAWTVAALPIFRRMLSSRSCSRSKTSRNGVACRPQFPD